MKYGIRKGLEDIAFELKGIRHVLLNMWALQEGESDSPHINPCVYADEYISSEECAKRLGISDQTIRNWIAMGKVKDKPGGWVEGIHYVNINPGANKKGILRIPWNLLVRTFAKNPGLAVRDYKDGDRKSYITNKYSLEFYLEDYYNRLADNAEENPTDSPPV